MTTSKLAFEHTRVLIVGDVMLDRYWHGATSRISPEAPVPVVRIDHREERPGGAGNVAANVAGLGGQAILLGVVGDDDAAAILTRELEARGISCRLTHSDRAATIVKLRVLSHHQQLIRLDFEDTDSGLDVVPLLAGFERELEQCDVLVLSDYAKGTLQDPSALIAQARAAGKTVVVDPKGRDFSRYRSASVLTPNLAELEAVVGTCAEEQTLIARSRELLRTCEFGALLITRGEQGITLVRADGDAEHLAAHTREVYDVTGAGDTVCAVLALGLAAGYSLVEATRLANAAAGVTVGKLGAASVNIAELERALQQAPLCDARIDGAGLLAAVAGARARGETVVMTNGCFDLLHAGHVAHLVEAKQLGNRLIVAVNDDASVRRLKGAQRPVTPLAQRMQVLSALACVDWVVPFSEDTPAKLIAQVLPDFLVKGGDYEPDDIAGADSVTNNGGKVLTLPHHEGLSTSAILDVLTNGRAESSA